MSITKVKRCCRTCVHCNIEQQVCDEGGFTEIGDLDKELTEEDCCAWKERPSWKKDGLAYAYCY